MDIQSLYYFSELAKDLHITRTAGRLYLSQQTLSNHIQRLEEYYGVPLLYRKPVLSLTAAGEAVLDFANHIMQEQDNLKRRLSDLEQETTGQIRFGASHLRTQACLPAILPAFSARYPQIELRLTNANSVELEPQVLDGRLDLAVLLAQSKEIDPNLRQTHLMDDQIFLCMTDRLLRRYYGDKAVLLRQTGQHGACVADFSRLPFCTASNRVGSILQNCFDEARITPNIYLSDSTLSVSVSACFQGLAACALTKSCIISHQSTLPEDFHCFPLFYQGMPVIQSLYLVSRKDRYQPQYMDFFQSLLMEQFHNLQKKEITNHAQS